MESLAGSKDTMMISLYGKKLEWYPKKIAVANIMSNRKMSALYFFNPFKKNPIVIHLICRLLIRRLWMDFCFNYFKISSSNFYNLYFHGNRQQYDRRGFYQKEEEK